MKNISIEPTNYIFMLILGCVSLAFVVVMNFDIGMSRDWDLLSPYVLGVVVTAAFFLVHGIENELLRRRMLVMVAAITAIQTVAFITVNANDAAFARPVRAIAR